MLHTHTEACYAFPQRLQLKIVHLVGGWPKATQHVVIEIYELNATTYNLTRCAPEPKYLRVILRLQEIELLFYPFQGVGDCELDGTL